MYSAEQYKTPKKDFDKTDSFRHHYKSICSSGTLYSHRNGFFYEFCETAKENIGYTYILNIFTKNILDEDRICKTFADNNITNVINDSLYKVSKMFKKKDAFNSKRKRMECLRLNKKEKFATVLHELNQAVLLAPKIDECKSIDDGYTLPLALITRADILLKQNKSILAYQDFKHISELDVPFLSRSKIFHKVLLSRLGIKQLVLKDFMSELDHMVKDLFKKEKRESSFIPNLVKIEKTALAGKEATANHTINPGDVIIAENPIASCLLPDFYKTHCQTCFKRFKICYACLDCSTAGFCSYTCRDVALGSYHKYECKISSLIIGSGMSILTQLALRIITQLGLQKCLTIYRDINNDVQDQELKEYLKLYKLEKNNEKRTVNDYYERTLMTIFLIQCLKQVDFFALKETKTDSKWSLLRNEIVIGTLLLKHLQLLQFNAHEIYEVCDENKSKTYYKRNPTYIGVGIYPTAARFNHGCYSATIRYFSGQMIILRSSRLLQEADVIAENYGAVFTKKTYDERQRFLSSRYWFDCCCEACYQKWPLLNDIKCTYTRIRCIYKSCTNYIDVYLNASDDCEEEYYCHKCKSSYKFSKLIQNILKRCILWYAHGITIMDKEYSLEAASKLLIALRTFHHIAYVPHRFTHLAENSLQYCLLNVK